MEQLISNPWWAGLIVLLTQIVFLYFRTLNVMYVADRKVLASILTGNAIGIAWLISIAIGANAIMNLQWQPILGHIIGGTLGTLWGFKTKK